MKERNYLSRAWKEMRAQKGWARPAALIALMRFIPIFGMIAADGFYYEWAREAAWKVDRPQANKYSKNFGATLKIGVLAWGVIIIWTAAGSFVTSLFAMIPLLGTIIGALMGLITVVINLVAMVAAMRAVIYDSFEPVLQIDQAFKMAAHDVGGLVRIFCISLLNWALALAMVAIVCILVLLLVPSVSFLLYGFGWSDLSILGALATVPLVLILSLGLSYLYFFASTVIKGLEIRALGYWMADFDVAKWKGQKDSLPFEQEQRDTYAEPVYPDFSAQAAEPEPEVVVEPEPTPTPEPASAPAPTPEPASAQELPAEERDESQ